MPSLHVSTTPLASTIELTSNANVCQDLMDVCAKTVSPSESSSSIAVYILCIRVGHKAKSSKKLLHNNMNNLG